MCNHKSDQTNFKIQNAFKQQKKRTPKKISETYLHNSALYYLERFSASKKHFKFVMLQKVKRSCLHHKEQDYNKCVKMVNALADKFEKSGLLDDVLYTSGLVSSLRRKDLSRNAIINKMLYKGISQERTIEALNKLNDDLCVSEDKAEWEAALKLAKKKRIGPYFTSENKVEDMKRSLGILARAGFSYQIASAVLETSRVKVRTH